MDAPPTHRSRTSRSRGAAPTIGAAPITPLVELQGLDAGPCRIFAKLEMCHPAGSVKGRIVGPMLDEAEADGRLKPGNTIVEASSGNTTIALAGECARRGYNLLALVPRSMSAEKVALHEALGVRLEFFDPDPSRPFQNVRREAAMKLASARDDYVTLDQFNAPANRKAHETQTGPELWEQMRASIDCYVAGAGTGGSLTGVAAAIKQPHRNPGAHVVMIDPPGSVLADAASGRAPTAGQLPAADGVGERFVPQTIDFDLIDEIRTVSRADALACVADLYRTTGLLCGPCTGYALHAALDYARRQTAEKRIAILACDRGDLYMSDPAFAAAIRGEPTQEVVTRPVETRAIAG